MCLSDHERMLNTSWNAANEEGIPIRYKNSPFKFAPSQNTESQLAILGQNLPIIFFFLLLWKALMPVCSLGLLCCSWFLHIGVARWGFLWQNKKIIRRRSQVHLSYLLPTRFLHLFLSLPPPAASQADEVLVWNFWFG